MPNKGIKFESAIPCDDFRTESNGKNIIIGTYQEEVIVNTQVSNFSFMFVLIGMAEEARKCNLSIALKVDGKMAVKMAATTEVKGMGHFMIPTPTFNVGVKNGTMVSLEVSLDDNEPIILRSLKVIQREESDALTEGAQMSGVAINIGEQGNS